MHDLLEMITAASALLVVLMSPWFYGLILSVRANRLRFHFSGRGFEVVNPKVRVLASGLTGPARGLKMRHTRFPRGAE